MSKKGLTHFIMPDTQVKHGVRLDHFEWAGRWCAEKKPDRIIHIGDFADIESLSTWDRGTMKHEGARYKKDVAACRKALELFFAPIRAEMKRVPTWKPTFDITLGNHENRINRAVNADATLEGVISVDDLGFEEFGFRVHEFLKVIVREGVAYSHYFTSGSKGMPVTSARALAMKKHMSCVMGHTQATEIDVSQKRGDGKRITGLFAGGFYQHEEDYLGHQGNEMKHQCWMLYNVKDGEFDLHCLPLSYLKERYART